MKIFKNYSVAILFFILASCVKYDQEIISEKTKLAGHWSVTAYISDEVVVGPFQIVIDDLTMLGKDSVIIAETSNEFWNFRAKAAVETVKGVFETELSHYESPMLKNVGVKIMNGKLIESDSISFDIQFEDDVQPFGTTYTLAGTRTRG